LSDEPSSEWTFPLFAARLLALGEEGLAFGYEQLHDWDETVAALTMQSWFPIGVTYRLGFFLASMSSNLAFARSLAAW
jgi:hypothetical protein